MASTTGTGAARVGRALVWILVAFEVVAMGGAGWSKFGNPGLWTAMFAEWGYPPASAYLVGGVELLGVVLLLVPRLASYAASVLIVVMVGALGTVLLHPGRMGPVPPLVHIAVLSVILVARFKVRWAPSV